MIIYHGANKQNQNLNKAKINLLYMINYRFLNTLYYLPLTLKQQSEQLEKLVKIVKIQSIEAVKPQILYKKNNTKTANKKNKQIKKDAVSNCTASILICFLFAE